MQRTRRLGGTSALFFLLCGIVAQGASQWQYIRIPAKELTQEFVMKNGFIRDHQWDDTYAFGYLKRSAERSLGVSQRRDIVELDAREWAHFAHDPKTLRRIESILPRVGPYEDFHTYETLTAELKTLATRYPQLATLESAGKSVEGRDLWYLRITASGVADSNKPKLLFVSSMHGDEVTGKEIMIYLIRDLLTHYETDSRLTALVNHAELFIMPSMNPDGTEKQQRWNAHDADLNRNFPNLDEPAFSTANREPETLALMELHRNNHFLVAMNFHGGSLCVNIPWDSKPNTDGQHFGDDNLMLALANAYSGANGPMVSVNQDSFHNGVTYGYEWYQVLGGMQDWADFFNQSTHATLEMSEVKWPDASTLAGFWSDNRESLLRYLEGGMTGFHFKVTDVAGNLLPVDVDLSTASRTLHYESGFVHRAAAAGSQTVTLRASGYQEQSISGSPVLFNGNYQTVVMQKL